MTNKTPFIGFEYKDIIVKQDYEAIYEDGYMNFGWDLETVKENTHPHRSLTMKFKRNRKIRNKAELTRLQRQFDALVERLDALERSKSFRAATFAYCTGVLGTAFIAGSVFAFTSFDNVVLMIVLAIPGFLGWIAPYFLFRAMFDQKALTVTPQIELAYDELYDVTKRANALLELSNVI